MADDEFTRLVMRPDSDGLPQPAILTERLPLPAAGQVLIAVEASGLNRADLLQRDGDYLPPPGESDTPGLECAGHVVAVGPGVDRFAVGDRVCALLGSGGHASHVLAAADLVMRMPEALSMVQAAALPEALCTAWWNLVALGGIKPGDRVLIYGANSGVGHLAGQVAAALGASVIAGTRGVQWHAPLRTLGFENVDMTGPDPVDDIRAAAPDGIDILLDLVGADYAATSQSVLAAGGRWLSIGLLGGENISLSLRSVIRNRWLITGSSLRSLSAPERARIVTGVEAELWPTVEAGGIRAHIDQVFPYADATAAFDRLEQPGTFGKIILKQESDTQT